MSLIKKIWSFGNKLVSLQLSKIANDSQNSVQIRHFALMNVCYPSQECVDVLLKYLNADNEQGAKIAMRVILGLPLFDVSDSISQNVAKFRRKNVRDDTREYVLRFYRKYRYLFERERYAKYLPKDNEDFLRVARILAGDFKSGGENREQIKMGLLVYLSDQIRKQKAELVNGPFDHFGSNEVVVSLDDNRNDVGIINEEARDFEVKFGGYGYYLTKPRQGKPLIIERLKRIKFK